MPDNPTGALTADSGIGSLRWPVMLFRRDQAPGPNSAISESLVLIATTHADIQSTYPGTFYASAQVDTPVTHMIRLRWTDYVENIYVIGRVTKRPSDETLRAELYRVRRVKETGGRKRFVEIECELEKVLTVSTTDPSEFAAFAENPPVLH